MVQIKYIGKCGISQIHNSLCFRNKSQTISDHPLKNFWKSGKFWASSELLKRNSCYWDTVYTNCWLSKIRSYAYVCYTLDVLFWWAVQFSWRCNFFLKIKIDDLCKGMLWAGIISKGSIFFFFIFPSIRVSKLENCLKAKKIHEQLDRKKENE